MRPIADVYLGLRNQRFTTTMPAGHAVFLMDWPINDAFSTVVAGSDGTASIYLSHGGGFIGGGQKYESLREAALRAAALALQMRSQMNATQDFSLPRPDEVRFYLITSEGIFSATASEADLKSSRSPFTKLGAAAQEIVTQYRLKYQSQKPAVN
ncbi:MAG TPA: hypothetical protein VN612_16040 [Acidobacteriaceae bacterium]|nr:hypothetical protein [Acidobacteriaceae bacterium]